MCICVCLCLKQGPSTCAGWELIRLDPSLVSMAERWLKLHSALRGPEAPLKPNALAYAWRSKEMRPARPSLQKLDGSGSKHNQLFI